mgnify:CR=1 FL=1
MSASSSRADARHAHFRVAHRRRHIAVDRAEIALSVDQQVAHGEALRHAHHRVVDGRVAVRVVLADHVADDAGGLLVGLVPVVAELAHRVQHAPMHRLEAIADVGQCARHDHAHGVIEIRAAHLVFEVDGENFARDVRHSGVRYRAPDCAGAWPRKHFFKWNGKRAILSQRITPPTLASNVSARSCAAILALISDKLRSSRNIARRCTHGNR